MVGQGDEEYAGHSEMRTYSISDPANAANALTKSITIMTTYTGSVYNSVRINNYNYSTDKALYGTTITNTNTTFTWFDVEWFR